MVYKNCLYMIGNELNMEVYKPKSIVEYQRRAFMAKENNIRLTFDSDIRATESSYELFAEDLPLAPVFPLDKVGCGFYFGKGFPYKACDSSSGKPGCSSCR